MPVTEILVLVNPRSGTNKSSGIMKTLRKLTSEISVCKFHLRETDTKENTVRLVRRALAKNFFAVVVVGGDGTVNSVGNLLRGTDTALGIIPTGSGNGIARHLGIATVVREAFKQIVYSKLYEADTLEVNGEFCLGVSGIGFEAHVAEMFNNSGSRGLVTYSKYAIMEYFKYKPERFELEVDGQIYEKRPFTISFANGSQWGNDFRIAPGASMRSGDIEVVTLSEINELSAMPTLYGLVSGTVNSLPWCKIYHGKEVSIRSDKPFAYHIDGEIKDPVTQIQVKVHPASLKILSPADKI